MSAEMDDDYDDDYGSGEACWRCMGDGGWHDCFDDTCCCLDPDEINVACPECGGSGVL